MPFTAPQALPSPFRGPLACALLALLLAASCSSPSGDALEGDDPANPAEPYTPVVKGADAPIGKFLMEVDQSIRAWQKLSLTAETETDRRKARGVELNLSRITKPRIDELIEQVETGPPANRIRAAGALGFTRDPAAQGPLLAALHDPNADVVHNALLGLAVLAMPDTPLGVICAHLESNPDSWIRSNAAHAILSIVNAGGTSDCVVPTARIALADEEPFVRAQAALILAAEMDRRSMPDIEALLRDPVPLVAASAANALVHFGRIDTELAPTAALGMASALDSAEPAARSRIHQALVALHGGVDLGQDAKDWLDWADDMKER